MFTRSARTTFLATLCIAASATMLAAAPASAQMDRPSKAVHYDDLDLATQAGVDTLNRRVDHAVRTVCGVDRAQTLREHASADDCAKVAMADATPRVQLAVAQARSDRGYAANDITIGTAR